MSQTAYNLDMDQAYAGLKVDSRFDHVETDQAEESGGIPFGYGVVAGTNPVTQAKLPDADTDTFRGITLHKHKEPVAGVVEYDDTEPMSVLRQGAAWVVVGEAVAVDAAAYLITASGKFGDTAAGNIATGGFFRTAAAADGDIAVLEINLP